MKLVIEINGQNHALDLQRNDERVIAEVGGRHYELTVREPERGVYLLFADYRVYECRVDSIGAQQDTASVHVGSNSYELRLSDPKRLRSAQSSGAHAGGRAKVVASMPGKVVRVLVERDAVVEAGDGLVVIEAMKMQNEMKAPKSGIVVELHAAAGATVNAGDVLVVIE
jgi:biotin carboxyl carrier protein